MSGLELENSVCTSSATILFYKIWIKVLLIVNPQFYKSYMILVSKSCFHSLVFLLQLTFNFSGGELQAVISWL